jgi:PAS domain S-box-containing protein
MSDMARAGQREDELPGLDTQFQALYTSGIIGILRANNERILDANDAFLAIVGYSRKEMEAGELHWRLMTPPEYEERDTRALQELNAAGSWSPFEKEYIRKDGTRVPILIAATRLQASPLQWVCYVLDLTAPRHEPGAERTLATIIEHVPVGIIVVDQMGHLVLMNDVGRQISGTAPSDEVAVADQTDVYALREPGSGRPLAPEETPIARALAGHIVENFEYVFRPTGGVTDTWIRTVAVPLSDAQGRRTGAVAVFEDVTEERVRERAKDDFLSSAAHDLKAPLTSLKGFSQLLERRLARQGALTREEAEPHLHRIIQTADRMGDLIAELLDIAQLQAGESLELTRSRVDLVDLVRRVADESAQAGLDRTIEVDATATDLVGDWDGPRLARVVANLVSNAVMYSPNTASIRITVDQEEHDGMPWVILRVHDQGIGIPARDLPRIFDRFYRASNVVERFGGTGIGLAGVKQIVEQHGGRITVESREGTGSTFTVWLPLDPVR